MSRNEVKMRRSNDSSCHRIHGASYLRTATLSTALAFLLSACGSGGGQGNAGSPVKPTVEVLAEYPLVAGKAETVSHGDSLRVELPAGALTGPGKLVVGSAPKAPAPTGLTTAVSFDIALSEDGNEVQPKAPIAITFRIAKSALRTDLPFEDQVAAGWHDWQNDVWVEVASTVKEVGDTVEVQLQLEHLTGVASWLLSGGWTVSASPHFRIRFDPEANAAGLGAKEIYGYVTQIRQLLEQSWDAYVGKSFVAPTSKVSVYVANASESYYNPLTGNIIISTQSYDDQATRHEVAHELFHLFQNTALNFKSMDWRRWWVEAAADYAADKLALQTGQLGKNVKPDFLGKSITTLDDNHEYALGLFVRYLVEKGGDFAKAQAAVFQDVQVLDHSESALASYVGTTLQTDFHLFYREFAAWLLFGADSPLIYDSLSKKVAGKAIMVGAGEKTAQGELPVTAGAVGVMTVKLESSSKPRSAKVTATGCESSFLLLATDAKGTAEKMATTGTAGQASVGPVALDAAQTMVILLNGSSACTAQVKVEVSDVQTGTCKVEFLPSSVDGYLCTDGSGPQEFLNSCSGDTLNRNKPECISGKCVAKPSPYDCAADQNQTCGEACGITGCVFTCVRRKT